MMIASLFISLWSQCTEADWLLVPQEGVEGPWVVLHDVQWVSDVKRSITMDLVNHQLGVVLALHWMVLLSLHLLGGDFGP